MICDECKGEGTITLLISKEKCAKCDGKGHLVKMAQGGFVSRDPYQPSEVTPERMAEARRKWIENLRGANFQPPTTPTPQLGSPANERN